MSSNEQATRITQSIADAWTPKAQAELANYKRMEAEGLTLSPSMNMAKGYAMQAQAAHNQINGK